MFLVLSHSAAVHPVPQQMIQTSTCPSMAPDVTTATEKQECSFCLKRHAEIDRLMEENLRLQEELSKKKMDEHFLKDDDVKVKYYTGLPCFAVFMGVLTDRPQTLTFLDGVAYFDAPETQPAKPVHCTSVWH